MKRSQAILASVVVALAIVISFQNCSKVQVASDGAGNASLGSTGGTGGGEGGGTDTGTPATVTTTTIPSGFDPGYPPQSGPKTEKFTFTPDRKADILLVIDNSTSMQPESNKLANKLVGFAKSLKQLGIDWQMCVLTTDLYGSSGAAQNWVGLGKKIFAKADADARTEAQATKIFVDTVNSFFPGPNMSGDERGIAALSRNVDQRASNGCYREGSIVAPIILSDEDERSWGGSQSLYDWEKNLAIAAGATPPSSSLLTLTSEDQGNVYFDKMRSLGMGNLMVNSIIVDNQSCRDSQQATLDANNKWYPAYIGTHYGKLSNLTNGVINSICAADYSNGLTGFAQRISGSTHTFKLLCVPKAGSLQISSAGLSQPNDYQATLSGQTLTVSSTRATAFEINLVYQCQ